MKLKKGDQAIVIAGDYKGKTGEVLRVVRDKNRVVIEGVNMRWRHPKRTQQNPNPERVQEEHPIHASNAMLLDAETGKGTRKRSSQEG